MKNFIYIILCLIVFIFLFVVGLIVAKNSSNERNKVANSIFDIYIGRTIKGGEVVTIINKAINENEKNKIQKDKNNHYVENNENSIKVFIKINDQTYTMEEILNNDTLKFIQNFNSVRFKCTNIEYHENTGKIKKLIIEDLIN